jgi:hypothetical protein
MSGGITEDYSEWARGHGGPFAKRVTNRIAFARADERTQFYFVRLSPGMSAKVGATEHSLP